MKFKLNKRAKNLLPGFACSLVSLFLAVAVNHYTCYQAPDVVLVGIAGSGLIGYAYGTFTMQQAQEEADVAQEQASEDNV